MGKAGADWRQWAGLVQSCRESYITQSQELFKAPLKTHAPNSFFYTPAITLEFKGVDASAKQVAEELDGRNRVQSNNKNNTKSKGMK